MNKYLNIQCYMRHQDSDDLWSGCICPEDLGDLARDVTVKEFNDAMLTIINYMARTGCTSTQVNVTMFLKNILKKKGIDFKEII